MTDRATPAILSSIDLGTNTCLMLVGTRQGQGYPIDVIADFATVVRLGEAVDRTRRFSDAAMQRTLECLTRYSLELKKFGGDPAHTVAVATSGSRDSTNREAFFDRIREKTGFQFKLISGEEEARLTHLGGLLPGMDPSLTAILDIGGGSTELRLASGGLSIDLGSVRFTERFQKSDPITDSDFWTMQESIDTAIINSKLPHWRQKSAPETQLCAVAGTATTLAAWFLELEKFDAQKIDRLTLSRGDIHRQVEELKWRTVRERESLPGVDPGRADVLLAGALILWRYMELLGFERVAISTRGLRYGVLNEKAF